MRCKFKYGDRVIINEKIGTGVIKSIRAKENTYLCLVKFDKPDLQPPEMEYPESRLAFADGFESVCPLCGDKWKETVFGNKKWKDCITCNLTQEEAVRKWYNKNKEKPKESDIDRAWKKVAKEIDAAYNQSLDVSSLEDEDDLDDYDYDFGWYVPNNQD